MRYAQAQSSAPIKIGFQAHRTGIGAAYGRWYEKTTDAAIKAINDAGGITGRPVEVIVEDDGTDPAAAPKWSASSPRSTRSMSPTARCFPTSSSARRRRRANRSCPISSSREGHHVASTKLNRYVFQPGITDVKSQIQAMAPWIAANAGKKVTQIFPDFAFGYDHRDYLPPALKAQGADVVAQIAIPPTESSFTKYFPQIPADTDVIYHVMVGPAVLTFVKELGEFYGSNRPQLFGFIDSLEAVDINSPGLEFLDGSHFWEGSPRYAQADDTDAQKAYRAAVGIDDNGASVDDAKDVSTAAHMFGCWETLYVIKKAMEDAGYKGPEDRAKLVEATEALTEFAEGPEHPQGRRPSTARSTSASASRTSRRSRAASSRSCTRPRSRTGSTSPKATTRPSRCDACQLVRRY